MSQSINNMNTGTPNPACRIPFYDPNQGLDLACTIAQILALLSGNPQFQTIYATPNTSGYVIVVNPATTGGNVWLLITPTGSFANLTINLPAGLDGQEIVVNSTQAVTGALSVVGATVGASAQPVNGAPTTLAANGHFRLKFNGVLNAWFVI